MRSPAGRAPRNDPPSVPLGEFPFPLTGTATESPYLTWIRNNSNYMAPRGLLDYVRAAAVLLRGTLINFVVFLPHLLLAAVLLAYSHHWLRDHPYVLTWWTLVAAVVYVLLFAVAIPVLRILVHDRSVETGSDSTVRSRDRYERSFGAVLLVLVAVAGLETLPLVLEWVHDRLQLGSLSWTVTLGAATAGLTAISGANRLLSSLDGVRKQAVMVIAGVVGLLVPLLVILSATDYLLYGIPPVDLWWLVPLLLPVGGALVVMLVALVGAVRGVLRQRELWITVLVLTGFLAISGASAGVVVYAVQRAADGSERVQRRLERIEELNQQFARLDGLSALPPEVGALVRAGVEVQRDLVERYSRFYADSVAAERLDSAEAEGLSGLRRMNRIQHLRRDFLAQQMRLASVGDQLSRRTDDELRSLRSQVVRLADADLRGSIERTVGDEEESTALLFDAFVGHFLDVALRGEEAPLAVGVDQVQHARAQFTQLVGAASVEFALIEARETLARADHRAVATFVSEPTLFKAVEAKFRDAPGRANDARVAGRDSLAALLTQTELLDLLVPSDSVARRKLVLDRHRDRLLRASLPRFAAPGDPDAERVNHATALALAQLVERGATYATVPGTRALDELARSPLHIARFHRDPTILRVRPDRGPAMSPTTDELSFAAARKLADHAISALDTDYMRGLAFGEGAGAAGERYAPVKPLAEAEAALLAPFLELARRPLRAVLEESLPRAAGMTYQLPGERDARTRAAIRDTSPAYWPAGLRQRYLVAIKALDHDTDALAALARHRLIARALGEQDEADYASLADALGWDVDEGQRRAALIGFAENPMTLLASDEMARIAAARFWRTDDEAADALVAMLSFGPHAMIEPAGLARAKRDVTNLMIAPKAIFLALTALLVALAVWCTVDVNLTSVHGLYRDRLAAAFLIGRDTSGDIGIEDDLDLDEICRYEARSVAPYHLVNVALNLQASRDVGIRDRKSDFFFFSKRFAGGARTGYCRSERLEQAFPQMDLATAMAISAAAAAPNMGRGTSPLLVALMTMLNVRLGFWVPNPGRLEASGRPRYRGPERRRSSRPPGYAFDAVFREELFELARRREQVYGDRSARPLPVSDTPTVANGLVGLAFSGGGIRSASLNLGIAQALHRAGVFEHCDYLSTVSGGGYLGSSISTLMRTRERLAATVAGTVRVERTAEAKLVTITPADDSAPHVHRFTTAAALGVRDGARVVAGQRLLQRRGANECAGIAGTVAVEPVANGDRVVTISGEGETKRWVFRCSRFDELLVKSGDRVREGQRLVARRDGLTDRFAWRVRPRALLRELGSKLDETSRWVNLSDGGHIENLAAMELLRRRCRHIIIGDGEADPSLRFAGLATLMRFARIDLGIAIDIDLDALRLRRAPQSHDAGQVSAAHFAVGTITYPPTTAGGEAETGYLLYLKSSFTSDEDEPIREYRHRNPAFPHESTADQAFDEAQFEAYRALGQHIAEDALEALPGRMADGPREMVPYETFVSWFDRLQQAASAAPRT